mmetsp:Transcript_101009/g.190332  ORF Transcript_101009/g.190332 Transcript_101009/m.190332 type:complete len:80 (-) Transcript_101009:278-517(-)
MQEKRWTLRSDAQNKETWQGSTCSCGLPLLVEETKTIAQLCKSMLLMLSSLSYIDCEEKEAATSNKLRRAESLLFPKKS